MHGKVKKCTKFQNARAELLFCKLNLLFCYVLVAVAVVFCFFFFLKVPISQVKVCRTEKAKDLKKSNAPAQLS